MRRFPRPLLVLAVLGVAVTGCTPAAAPAPSASAAAPQGTDAETLCAASTGGEDDVCVLEDATATDALDFDGYRVVKLIGGRFAGPVEIRGAEQIVVTGASFSDDLTVDATGGAVVKLSSIGGALSVEGGHGVTLVQNTVSGDLLCADGVQVNGDGNAVGGDTTGTCTRVVG